MTQSRPWSRDDGIVAFSQTDFTEDLKKITVPVLVMHSEDDQIVPYEERHLENLQGLSARHDHDEGRIIKADLLDFITG